MVHPVVAVRRDGDGTLIDFPEGDAAGERRESIVYLETVRADARQRRALIGALDATLDDVRAAVADWPLMQAAMMGNVFEQSKNAITQMQEQMLGAFGVKR